MKKKIVLLFLALLGKSAFSAEDNKALRGHIDELNTKRIELVGQLNFITNDKNYELLKLMAKIRTHDNANARRMTTYDNIIALAKELAKKDVAIKELTDRVVELNKEEIDIRSEIVFLDNKITELNKMLRQ